MLHQYRQFHCIPTKRWHLDRPLATGKNKRGIGIIKDEFGEKIMIKFVGLRAKTYSYLIDDGSKDKTAKGTQKVCHKKNI